MTSLVLAFSARWLSSRAIEVPDYNAGYLNSTVSIERLPSEAAGSMTLTLSGIVVGSAYRIENASDGSLLAQGTAASSSVDVPLSYFIPNRTARIKVRKGTSAPLYKPLETQAVIGPDDQSVYIAQIPDE